MLGPNELFADNADQDQTAQNVQSDLWSTLSATFYHAMVDRTLK